MKIPSQTKYRKYYKINVNNNETRQLALRYGIFGIKAQENGYLRLAQMERIKTDIIKKLKDKMDIYFNFYPVYSLTTKGTARMGAGKGDIYDWYVPVKKGKIMIEFINSKMTLGEIKKIVKYSSHKWSIKIKVTTIKKNLYEK